MREIRRGARHAHIRPARSFDGRLPRPERAGRFVRRSYAPRPDARGEANARARLTEHDALELLVRMLEGESPQIAEEYGVTRSAANEIRHGRAWWHLRDQLPPRLRRKHDELIDVKFHERRLRRARRRTQL